MLASMSVKDYMAANLVTFTPDMDVLDAIHLLLQNRISGAPVVDKFGNIVGLLSEKDCLRIALHASYYEEKGGRVEEFMSRTVKTINTDTSLVEVAQMFLDEAYRRYPVVDENNLLVGQISRRDVLRALENIW
jgi:CBS domain-containing protein